MLQLNIWLLNKSISMEFFLIKYGKECTLLYILNSFSSTSHVQHRETWQPFLRENINNRVPLNGPVKDRVWWQSELLKGKHSLLVYFSINRLVIVLGMHSEQNIGMSYKSRLYFKSQGSVILCEETTLRYNFTSACCPLTCFSYFCTETKHILIFHFHTLTITIISFNLILFLFDLIFHLKSEQDDAIVFSEERKYDPVL